ncbi:outer membrane beta-barrel protein [bacterium]|nr:outer membrane beta-barrel protein [bacterium]
MKKIILTLLFAVWAIPGSAHAYADYVNSVAQRYCAYVNFGYGSYAMNDINDFLDLSNSSFVAFGGTPTPKIVGGLNFMLGAAYGISDYMIAGFEYGGLVAQTENQPLPEVTQGIDIPAVEVGFFLKLALPMQNIFLLTMGAGMYHFSLLDGIYEVEDPATYFSETFSGSTLAYKVMGGGEVFLNENFSLSADIGYRIANISEITDASESVIWTNQDGSNFTIDFSGLFWQAGIKYYFDLHL